MSTINWKATPTDPNMTLVVEAYKAFHDNPGNQEKIWEAMYRNAEMLSGVANAQVEKIQYLEEKTKSQEKEISAFQVKKMRLDYMEACEKNELYLANSSFKDLEDFYKKTKKDLDTVTHRFDNVQKIKNRLEGEVTDYKEELQKTKKKNESLEVMLRAVRLSNEKIFDENTKLQQTLAHIYGNHRTKVAELEKRINNYKLRLERAKNQAELFRKSASIKAAKKSTLVNLRIELAKLRITLKEREEERKAYHDGFEVIYNTIKNQSEEGTSEENRASLRKAKSLLGV